MFRKCLWVCQLRSSSIDMFWCSNYEAYWWLPMRSRSEDSGNKFARILNWIEHTLYKTACQHCCCLNKIQWVGFQAWLVWTHFKALQSASPAADFFFWIPYPYLILAVYGGVCRVERQKFLWQSGSPLAQMLCCKESTKYTCMATGILDCLAISLEATKLDGDIKAFFQMLLFLAHWVTSADDVCIWSNLIAVL